MKKAEQHIILIFGLLSLLRVAGLGFTYIDTDFLHNIGNSFYGVSTLLSIPSILFIIYLIIRRAPFSIILVPILYVLYPLLQIFLAIIGITFGIPMYNTEFSNTFLFNLIMNNYFDMIYYLSIFFYSIVLLKSIKSHAGSP